MDESAATFDLFPTFYAIQNSFTTFCRPSIIFSSILVGNQKKNASHRGFMIHDFLEKKSRRGTCINR